MRILVDEDEDEAKGNTSRRSQSMRQDAEDRPGETVRRVPL